jgi:dolichyl-phosphate-mannose--protein O-mannosyl transferase
MLVFISNPTNATKQRSPRSRVPRSAHTDVVKIARGEWIEAFHKVTGIVIHAHQDPSLSLNNSNMLEIGTEAAVKGI